MRGHLLGHSLLVADALRPGDSVLAWFDAT